jgi:hypothetical protein
MEISIHLLIIHLTLCKEMLTARLRTLQTCLQMNQSNKNHLNYLKDLLIKGIKKKVIQKKNASRRTPTWVDKLHKKKKTRANNNADNIFVEFGSFTSFSQLLMVK